MELYHSSIGQGHNVISGFDLVTLHVDRFMYPYGTATSHCFLHVVWRWGHDITVTYWVPLHKIVSKLQAQCNFECYIPGILVAVLEYCQILNQPHSSKLCVLLQTLQKLYNVYIVYQNMVSKTNFSLFQRQNTQNKTMETQNCLNSILFPPHLKMKELCYMFTNGEIDQ